VAVNKKSILPGLIVAGNLYFLQEENIKNVFNKKESKLFKFLKQPRLPITF